MGISFTADEMYAIAESIERNGAAFYRQAANLRGCKADKDFLLELAAMEDEHQAVFAGLRAKLSASEQETNVYDPDNEASMYLSTMADLHPGEGNVTARNLLNGRESLKDIVAIAIDLERKSILFYNGLREYITTSKVQKTIDRIISEEKKHIVVLSKILHKLRR